MSIYMNAIPAKSKAPESSAIVAYLPGAYFHDSLVIPVEDPSLSAPGYFLKALLATPSWINRLMSVRNNVVSAFGLKNLGTLSQLDQVKSASAYKPGNRVGIFTCILPPPTRCFSETRTNTSMSSSLYTKALRLKADKYLSALCEIQWVTEFHIEPKLCGVEHVNIQHTRPERTNGGSGTHQ
jgi:hypothetical protein